MSKHKITTTDGLAILGSLAPENTPELQAMAAMERQKLKIAEQLYRLRKERGLTQGEVAKLVGTTVSVISRIEDADYEGHTLSTIQKFCQALGYDFEPEFRPRMHFRFKSPARKRMSAPGAWKEIPAPNRLMAAGEEQLLQAA